MDRSAARRVGSGGGRTRRRLAPAASLRNRRGFLERATQLLALGIAGDQLELVERLTWRRRFFPSAAIPSTAITPGYYTPSFLFWAVEPGAYSVVFDPLSRSLSVPGYTV